MKRIGNEMWCYLEIVLKRDEIPYEYHKESGYVETHISARRFKEAVEDAFCEKQRSESLGNIPVYSLKTMKDKEKVKRLMKINGSRSFVILRKDAHEYAKRYVY